MKHQVLPIFLCFLLTTAGVEGKRKVTTVRLETTAGTIRLELSDETPIHRDNFIKLCRDGYYDGTLFHRVIKDFMIQGGDPDRRVRFIEGQDTLQDNTQSAGGRTWLSPLRTKPLGDGGPDYTLPAEFDLPWLYHIRGALAAARESDDVNPEMRSSGSQFYIVYGRSFGENSLGKVRGTLAEKGIEMNREMWNDYLQHGGAPHLDGTYTVFGHVVEGMKVVKSIQSTDTDKDDRPLQDIVILRTIVEDKK